MLGRLTALYPFLFAVLPLLYLAERHPGRVTIPNLLLVLGVTLAGFGLVYLVARIGLRHRAGGRLPALVTLLAVVLFYGLSPTTRWFPGGSRAPQFVAFALLAIALGVLAIYSLSRRPRLLETGAAFLTITGTLLVARFAVDIAVSTLRNRSAVAESDLGAQVLRPIDGPMPAPKPRRDVYLLVLDEYANAEVLRERLGYDNSAFEDSLRALGFHIPVEVSSNYLHTTLSLPSLLNAAHLHTLAHEQPDAKDPTLVSHLLERNRIARFLQARRYRYIFFPSLWWKPTLQSGISDSVVDVWSGFNPVRELSRSEFRRTVWKLTALRFLLRGYPWDADHVNRTLNGFARLHEVKEPVFAFAHVLSPHWPYVMDSDCRTLPHLGRENRNDPEGYVRQLQCINSLVLDAVTELIRESEVSPVIVIQGDHGTKTLNFSDARSAEQVAPKAAQERFGAFGAYYLPDSGEMAFGDSVTIVNVLGNVLRHYFGAELARQPDDRYVSLIASPYDLVPSHESPPTSTMERIPRAPRRHRSDDTAAGAPVRGLRSSGSSRPGTYQAGAAGRSRDAGGLGR